MNKKLVCILLCVCMLAGTFLMTGCSVAGGDSSAVGGEETTGTASSLDRSSMTLSLWVPTSKDTTEEALYLAEEAINRITQTEFDTAIKLYGIPEDEYDAVIKDRITTLETRVNEAEQKAIEQRKKEIEAAKNGEDYIPDSTAYENPNMDGDYSLVVRGASGYTPIEKNQMDIFLIHGEEDYDYYAENYYIESLDEEITNSCKVLKSYIYPDFFTAAQNDGTVYGVPNNHAVGEFTYFLVNKRLTEEEFLNPDKLTSLSDCQEFIEDVAKYHKDVTPIYGDYAPSYYRFWSGKDQATFSTLASRIMYSTPIEEVAFNNIFSYNNYTSNFYLYKMFKEKGYVATTEPKEFGVGYVTCSAEEVQKYADDYNIITYLRPEGKRADYLKSVFAVSCFTKSTARSMEIITMLNTDTELRTILQYGAEGTHWKYDEEDKNIIVKLSDDYKMNIEDTGNEFITFPDYGKSMDAWKYAKEQNLNSYYPITGNFLNYQNESNAELLAGFDKFNAEIWNRINNMKSDEFKASIASLEGEVEDNEYFQKLSYIPSDNDSRTGRTEENGWFASASITNLWTEYFNELMGIDQ